MPVIELKHHRMFYEDVGEGFPVLFGHSYLWDASMWAPQVEALAASYRCIVPELWGHGSSQPPPRDGPVYSLEELTEDHAQLVNALGLERFAVVGLSVGGMWGARLAMYLPGRVSGLVVAGSDLAAEPTPSKRRFFQMIDTVARAGALPPPVIEAMCPLFFSDETLARRPALADRFRASMAAIPHARLPGILAIGRGIFGRENLTMRLREIDCPTRIIVGEQDRSRPPVESERMAQYIQHTDLHVLHGAGHICNLEAPDQVTALLEDFLASATDPA